MGMRKGKSVVNVADKSSRAAMGLRAHTTLDGRTADELLCLQQIIESDQDRQHERDWTWRRYLSVKRIAENSQDLFAQDSFICRYLDVMLSERFRAYMVLD